MNDVLTVSQLNCYVKSLLDGDFRLKDLLLRGEVSNFTNHFRSGHFYFTLKEGNSAVKAVMFQNYAKELRFEPENGMAVIVRCSVSLYERDGSYQIYVYDMQPDGQGVLQVAFEQLYRKLEQKGLFDPDKKKPIPRFAERIGVVTSDTGAALWDVVNVLSRRSPHATLVLAPALVQGEGAEHSLCNALDALEQRGNCDVILITRGGGSMEDLWCFNSEKLVYKIAECTTPIISAVGHETDFTLCDYAADLRAPTPSAAAEIASENREELLNQISNLQNKIKMLAENKFTAKQQSLSQLLQRGCFADPARTVKNYEKELEYLANTIHNSVKNGIIRGQEHLTLQAARLEALNPLARLAKGYSITMKDGHSLTSIEDIEEGDKLTVRLYDGTATVQVLEKSSVKGMRKWQKN